MKIIRQLGSIVFIVLIFSGSYKSYGQYCVPGYHNICGENAFNLSFINDFSINTLQNLHSGCNGNPNNYINYPISEFTTQLEQGGEYEVMVSCYFEETIRLYFDFNKDYDFRDPGEYYDLGTTPPDSVLYVKITIPASASGDIRMRVRAGDSDYLPTDDCRMMYWGETEDYTVTIVPPYSMSLLQTSVIQDSSFVFPGSVMQKVVGVEIETSGSLSPLQLTDLHFNTGATTELEDISNARVFYTGTDRNFSGDVEFGTAVTSPSGDFSFSGNQTLMQGKNFFWLVYDIRAEAYLDNYVDASCTSLTLSGVDYVPVNPDPSGKRQIFDYTLMRNGSETVDRMYFFDDGGYASNYTRTDYVFTVYPEAVGQSLRADFLEFNLSEIAEVGCDLMHIYDGNSTSAPLIGTYCSDSPVTVVSSSADGSLTFSFEINTSDGASSPGWKVLFTNVASGAAPVASISGYERVPRGSSASISLSLTGVPPLTVVYTNGHITDTLTGITSATHQFSVNEPGIYTILKVIDATSRSGTFSGSAIVEWIGEFKAPEGISPNDDGYNDYFVIEGIDGKRTSLKVFNREGGVVFENDNYDNQWDGKNNSGERLPDGTYYFIVKAEGESKILKSYVEIRR